MERTIVCRYGPATCNCTGRTITASVCHAEEFEIGIGDDIAHVSTGYSSSTCATVPIPPGRCAYWKYTFHCVHRCSFFGLWCTTSCSNGRATVYDFPATCGPAPTPRARGGLTAAPWTP